MANYSFKVKFLLVMFILNLNLFSETILDQAFEKKLKFEDKRYSPKELFETLSQQLGIEFFYKGEEDYTMVIKEFNNLPAKTILSFLENKTFIFYLKFSEKDHPYIVVEESKFFEQNIKGKREKGERIGIEMYESSIKEILEELEKKYNKKFLIQNDKILEKKTSLKIENVKFEELLKKLSEEIGFNYKIEEDKVRIW